MINLDVQPGHNQLPSTEEFEASNGLMIDDRTDTNSVIARFSENLREKVREEVEQNYREERERGVKDDIGSDKALDLEETGKLAERAVYVYLAWKGFKPEFSPERYDTYDIIVYNYYLDVKCSDNREHQQSFANFRRTKYRKMLDQKRRGRQIATHVVYCRRLSQHDIEIVGVVRFEDVKAHKFYELFESFEIDKPYEGEPRYYRIPFAPCEDGNCSWSASPYHATKYRPITFQGFVRALQQPEGFVWPASQLERRPLACDVIPVNRYDVIAVIVWPDSVTIERRQRLDYIEWLQSRRRN